MKVWVAVVITAWVEVSKKSSGVCSISCYTKTVLIGEKWTKIETSFVKHLEDFWDIKILGFLALNIYLMKINILRIHLNILKILLNIFPQYLNHFIYNTKKKAHQIYENRKRRNYINYPNKTRQ